MDGARTFVRFTAVAICAGFATALHAQAGGAQQASGAPEKPAQGAEVLRVCADPHNLPQSDSAGAGYENKLAEQLGRDLGRKVEYYFFPQRMGFVRNTLRARDETTQQFKCDLIMGVPKGYELTATTRPYMRSTYAIIGPARKELQNLRSAADLLKLPKEEVRKLRFGIFARSPAADWLLRNGLFDRATIYPAQSGDPKEHPASVIGRDLAAGKIDAAIVWGPVAGFLAMHHEGDDEWMAVPFLPDPAIKFDYEISMGVRFGEKEWKDTLDQWIATHQDDIRRILESYRVPLLEVAEGPRLGSHEDDD